jgi:hypothetical protein
MSNERVVFTGKMNEGTGAPTSNAEFVVEAQADGMFLAVGCQKGKVSLTAAERLAKEILAGVEKAKKLVVSRPYFTVTFNNGRAEDMGPYTALDYLDATNELQCTFADFSTRAGQTVLYPAGVVDKMWPHKN